MPGIAVPASPCTIRRIAIKISLASSASRLGEASAGVRFPRRPFLVCKRMCYSVYKLRAGGWRLEGRAFRILSFCS